ncbi:MAG: quinone-dependent dihydroorotate dehydrogenase [Alphaproteobacteria bacterium]|nr:quinone-dependent dihydroorotate dehydrogenase [Alphaproteobacteria bacterium]
MISMYKFAKPFLHLLDAEDAHQATIALLKILPRLKPPQDNSNLSVQTFGLSFPNPIGLAAGFDKDAEVFEAMLTLGFGFVEVGTLTPRAQPGNPRPRAFRLTPDRGVINRYGFNNHGHAPARARLERYRQSGIIGVNIGANKDATDRIQDYVAGIDAFATVASYFTINVSSPNTPGLRDLQEPKMLTELLARVIEIRNKQNFYKPILLKIAPDLSYAQLDDIVHVARTRGVDGMIVSNTTLARPRMLKSPYREEAGGLSGAPLFNASTRILAQTYLRVENQFPLIGVGGIDSPETARIKIEAGATLVQLYSALIYEGHELIEKIKNDLSQMLQREGIPLSELVGRQARHYAQS